MMNDLNGKILIKPNAPGIIALLKKHVAGYDAARFEIVAIRLYSASELVLTVFARDLQDHSSTVPEGKLPVRKFKITDPAPAELLEMMSEFNFTVCNDAYDLDEMEVMNK